MLLIFPLLAKAHGGVDIIGNQCRLTVGPYQMLFSGYQPKTSAKEFCDDIPNAGETIIVLDFMQPILRHQLVDYRVIKDVNHIGNNATKKDLGSVADIAAATILYLPPQRYHSGTFNVQHRFEAGRYIGIVSATDSETHQQHFSVFAFGVGESMNPILKRTLWGFFGVLLLGFSLFWLKRK